MEVNLPVRILGRGIFVFVATVVMVMLPAQAAPSSSSSKEVCQATAGKNVIRYSCDYVANEYQKGSPLSLKLDYSCSMGCGGMLAFGLDQPGYEPKGEVNGRILSLDRRSQGSMAFTMKFDQLAENPSSRGRAEGTAFMTVLVNVDDGTGKYRPTPLPFQVHVNSHPGGSGGSN